MSYIFISYAHKNSEQVLPVINTLRENGYRVWYDDGIDPGTEYDEFIAQKIYESGCFFSFVSQDYLMSSYCNREIKYACRLEKACLMIYLEDVCLSKGMEMLLGGLQSIFMYKYPIKEQFYEKLFSTNGINEFRDVQEIVSETVSENVEELVFEDVDPVPEKIVSQEEISDKLFYRNVQYMVNGDFIIICGCKEGTKSITIPEEIKGVPVKKIGLDAFKGCDSLVTVVVPNSVEEIGSNAFEGCSNLVSVAIVNKACVVAADAFMNCPKLKSNSREEASNGEYDVNKWEQYLEIDLQKMEVVHCKKDVKKVIIPNEIDGKKVTSIGRRAFKDCQKMTRVVIPQGIREIKEEAFSHCVQLSRLELPETVETIGDGAFEVCYRLERVALSKNLKLIGRNAFYNCYKLTKIDIPTVVKEIGTKAFFATGDLNLTGINESRCEMLAKGDSLSACVRLGNMYEQGIDVKADEDKALQWYFKAVGVWQEMDHADYILKPPAPYLGLARVLEKKNDIDGAIKWYKEAARNGDTDANYSLGRLYEKSDHLKKWAMVWYKEAATHGDVESMYALGRLYKQQDNADEAIVWYENAAKKEHVNAMYELACLYKKKNNTERAIKWYKKVATHGDVESMYALGHLYKQQDNADEAIVWYENAAKKEHVNAMYELAFLYKMKNNIENAIKWYKEAASRNDVKSMKKLGKLYKKENISESIYWYQKAVESGDLYAMCNLAHMYLETKEMDKAVEWYKKAAEEDISNAKFCLGTLYLSGQGLEKNVEQAVMMYQEAAAKNHALAMYILAILCGTGYGMERNEEKAVQWIERAQKKGTFGEVVAKQEGSKLTRKEQILVVSKLLAKAKMLEDSLNANICICEGSDKEQLDLWRVLLWYEELANRGDAMGCCGLGYIYEMGWGVEKDVDVAIEWYSKAVKQGDLIAKEMLKSCKKKNGRGGLLGFWV